MIKALRVVALALIATVRLPAQEPLTWGQVETLFGNRNYAAVLAQVDRFIGSNETATPSRVLFVRGAARCEMLWQMRTAVPLGSDQPIDPRRNSFEISVSDKFAQLLATARDDLARAESAHLEERFALKKDRDLSFEQLLVGYQATVALEYAQYVAQTRASFTPVLRALSTLRSAKSVSGLTFEQSLEEWQLSPAHLAAELRALLAQGDFTAAFSAFSRWHRRDSGTPRADHALTALVAASDLTGNYARTRGYLLAAALAQLKADPASGKNGRMEPFKRATRGHLQNLQFISAVKREEISRPLQLARYAGMLHLDDTATPEKRAYVRTAVSRIRDEFKETPPLDPELFAWLSQIQTGNPAEIAAARAALEKHLARDPENAGLRAVRGIAAHASGDLPLAETDLVFATRQDPCWMFSLNAFQTLAQVYEKTNRPELAKKSTQQLAQLGQLLSALAAP